MTGRCNPLTLCLVTEVRFDQVIFRIPKGQTPVQWREINGVSSKQRWEFCQGSSSSWAQEFSPPQCRWALTSQAYFLYWEFGSRFLFAVFKKRERNNNLLCAHYYAAAVKKAEGMTHCPLNTSCTFQPPHLCSRPSHSALAPPGLPGRLCAWKPHLWPDHLSAVPR